MRRLSLIILFIMVCSSAMLGRPMGEPQDSLPVDTAVDDVYRRYAMVQQQMMEVDWSRVLLKFSLKIGLRIGVVDVLKHNVHEMRPDGSADNSFPSRHAVWAYGIAGTLAYSTGNMTPWVTVIGQTAANGVGMQRVMARRHWPGDVLAGAGIGLGLDIAVRGLTNLIYGDNHDYHGWNKCHNSLERCIVSSTGATLPLESRFGDLTLGMGFTSSLDFTLPTSRLFGLRFSSTLASSPIKSGCSLVAPLNTLSVEAGPTVHADIADGPVAISVSTLGGYRKHFAVKEVEVNKGSFTAEFSAAVTVTLTSRLSIGAETGISVGKVEIGGVGRTLPSFTAGIISRATF